jgi:hypothetical protein
MKIKEKDLIITDPCYIALDKDWGESFNYDDYVIDSPEFSQYMWESTGYGDGSPKVLNVPSQTTPEEYINDLVELDEDDKDIIGKCAVDSGTFGVFILEEVLKYNPDFLDELSKSCYHIVRNFSGIVYTGYDEEEYIHFILKPEDSQKYSIITD